VQTIQSKITEAVRATVEGGPRVGAAPDRRTGLELIAAAEASNAGVWYVMRGLESVLAVRYSFQPAYGTFRLSGQAVMAPGAQAARAHPSTYLAQYDRNTGSPGGVFAYHHLTWEDAGRLAGFIRLISHLTAPYTAKAAVAAEAAEAATS
jgi:hypothetical protein